MTARYPVTMHISAEMIEKIDQPIDEALVSRRPGGGNSSQAYLKGDIIADQLNEVFGPLGWSKVSKIHSVDDWDEVKTITRNNTSKEVTMHMVQVISDVTLTIKPMTPGGTETVYTEQGVGYGEVEQGKSRKEALGMAVKGASTDGLKRCSNLLGKRFGMMMASSGSQVDIEYAHNGKTADLNKARDIRRRSGVSARSENDGRREEDRGQRADGSSRGSNNVRDIGGGTREEARRDEARTSHDREQEQRRSASREEQAPARTRENAPVNKDEQTTRAPEAADGKPKAGRRMPSTTYALDSVPVTLNDQTDFGATLAARVKEMRQKNDREGLVKQHINTIRNLDGPIRKRLRELLQQEGVDVDRIAA